MSKVMRDLQIESLARAIWNYYYPHGGSVYRSYDELQERDKELHRSEARQVARFLDGDADLVAALTKQPVEMDRS